jgi:Fe-S cluster assembly protein SufB
LHAAVVEIFVKPSARVRYTTVQNWSTNVYNLVTKRARAEKNAFMEWIDCNIGSQITMKYPSVLLAGEGARGEVLSIAFANKGQVQDAGAKMIHMAPHTSSRIVSKSISKAGGQTSYRGLVTVSPLAHNSSVYVSCDALLLDEHSRSDTYPFMKIKNQDVEIQHEATVEKLGEEKLFYLMSRGIAKAEAEGLLVNGFIEPVSREIPLEYSIELNRLINLEMEGSVG